MAREQVIQNQTSKNFYKEELQNQETLQGKVLEVGSRMTYIVSITLPFEVQSRFQSTTLKKYPGSKTYFTQKGLRIALFMKKMRESCITCTYLIDSSDSLSAVLNKYVGKHALNAYEIFSLKSNEIVPNTLLCQYTK